MAITPMMGDLSMVQAIILIMVILNHNIDFIFILMLATTFPCNPGYQPRHPHQHRKHRLHLHLDVGNYLPMVQA